MGGGRSGPPFDGVFNLVHDPPVAVTMLLGGDPPSPVQYRRLRRYRRRPALRARIRPAEAEGITRARAPVLARPRKATSRRSA
jgi:hypothetical protein